MPFSLRRLKGFFLGVDCSGPVISGTVCTPSIFISNLCFFRNAFLSYNFYYLFFAFVFHKKVRKKMGGLNKRNLSSHSSGICKSKSKAIIRVGSFSGLQGKDVFQASLLSLLLCLFTWSSLSLVCVPISSSSEGTVIRGWGPS